MSFRVEQCFYFSKRAWLDFFGISVVSDRATFVTQPAIRALRPIAQSVHREHLHAHHCSLSPKRKPSWCTKNHKTMAGGDEIQMVSCLSLLFKKTNVIIFGTNNAIEILFLINDSIAQLERNKTFNLVVTGSILQIYFCKFSAFRTSFTIILQCPAGRFICLWAVFH
jgi:hypothetical protein